VGKKEKTEPPSPLSRGGNRSIGVRQTYRKKESVPSGSSIRPSKDWGGAGEKKGGGVNL